MFQLAAFYDIGGIETSDPQIGDIESETISGYGAGIRLFYKDIFTFKFDVGFPVDKIETPDFEEDDAYFYFLISLKLF